MCNCFALTTGEACAVVGRSNRCMLNVCACSGPMSVCMNCSAVKINGNYTLTLEGPLNPRVLAAIADNDEVTCVCKECCGNGTKTVTVEGTATAVDSCNRCNMKIRVYDTDISGVCCR